MAPPRRPDRPPRPVLTEEARAFIDGILLAERRTPRKQRHTARRAMAPGGRYQLPAWSEALDRCGTDVIDDQRKIASRCKSCNILSTGP